MDIHIEYGMPDDEELAALVVVLDALAGQAPQAAPARRPLGLGRRLRPSYRPAGAWNGQPL